MILLSSCTARKVSSTLNDIASYIQDRPDSALAALRGIDTTLLSTRSLRAHYALLHAMALDKNWIDTADERVIAPAVAYYGKHGPVDRRAKACFYLGRIQYNGHHYQEAILSFDQALQWAMLFSDDRFKSLVFLSIGETYGATSLFEEALSFSDSSLGYSLKAGDTNLVNASRFRIAQNHNNLKHYAEADSLYRQMLADSSLINNEHLYPRVLAGYAMTVLGFNDDCEKARNLFEQCLSHGRFDNYNQWGAYAYCLAATGDLAKAGQIFKSLQARGLEDSFSFQGWKSRFEHASGNLDEAYKLLSQALDRQSEASRKVLRQSVIKAQLDNSNAQNRILREKALTHKILLLLAFFILAAAFVFMIQRFRVRSRKASEERESLLETIARLGEQQPQNRMTEKYVEVYRSYLQQMGAIRDMLRDCDTEEGTMRLIQRLKTMMQNLRLDKIRQGEFEAMMNREFDDVMAHYREDFPGGKESDYLVVCYLFAGFDGATICTLTGLPSKQAVYSRKTRLLQKIRTGKSPHQEQFVRMLR